MNLGQAEAIARAARATSWFGGLSGFGGTLRRSVHRQGQLWVVGSEADEPWHFTAHLEALARYRGVPELAPTLVRWQRPSNASAPGISVDDMAAGGIGQTVLAISEDPDDPELLERLADAKRRGATILGLTSGDGDGMDSVAHEAHTVAADATARVGRLAMLCDFEVATHLVGVTATSVRGEGAVSRWRAWRPRHRGLPAVPDEPRAS